MNKLTGQKLGLAILTLMSVDSLARAQDARELVRNAIDHWRGLTSYTEMTMVIHRPDWERSMSLMAWTEGDKRSLVRVTAPTRDRGNSTLMDDNNMWSFSPKINRVIKIPSSMMGQSWMGSDFSNTDISRADDIVDQYVHTLLNTTEVEGQTVYEIQSVPLENAAVVWGKEILKIRDDNVLVEQGFYDQDGELVKQMTSLEIGEMNGRTIAIRQRMGKVETPGEWTEITVATVEYDIELDDNVFTLSNLRNPRD